MKVTTRGSMVLSGPFFERDPAETFAQNAARMMTAVGIEAELDLKARIASIPPAGVATGQTRRRLRGRARSTAGRPWRTTAVAGLPRSEAGPDPIASYAALAQIERAYGPVAATTRSLRKARAVQVAELTKGIG